MSDSFCVNPWVSMHYIMGQQINPCCLFVGGVKTNAVNEYATSTELAEIKHSLLNNKKIPECSTCWSQESRGGISKRQRDNQTYKNIFDYRFKKNLEEPNSSFVEYYVRLGNHCNLRCTSCNDQLSTGWISEKKKFNLSHSPVIEITSADPIWQHLRDHAKDIASIEFIGGEPFMMNTGEQRDLFKYFVESGHARHIKLKYNTNGTRMPTEQIEFWNEFNNIELNVSMDGVRNRFEYLRFPAVWSEFDANLTEYKELAKKLPNLKLTVIHTLSIFNIGYVQETIDYCIKKEIPVFFNMLHIPLWFNIYNFTTPVNQWIQRQIKNIDHPDIKNIYNQLSTTTGNSNVEFLDNCYKIDQRRDLSIAKTFPELYQCLI